jgi:hypothetical protein
MNKQTVTQLAHNGNDPPNAIDILYEITERDEQPKGVIIESKDIPYNLGPTVGDIYCARRTMMYAGHKYLVQVTKIE